MDILEKLWSWISLNIISPISWNPIKALFNKGIYYELKEHQLDYIRRLIARDYYIILVRRKTHLTTYLISLGGLLKTGKFGYWSHALMNLEGDPLNDNDYELMEAIGKGVVHSTFMSVFDCDSVALLKPKNFTNEDWTEALDKLKKQEGKTYDTLFDLADEESLSCAELVLASLGGDLDKLKSFSALVKKYNIVTPDMIYNCGDFEVVYEIRN